MSQTAGRPSLFSLPPHAVSSSSVQPSRVCCSVAHSRQQVETTKCPRSLVTLTSLLQPAPLSAPAPRCSWALLLQSGLPDSRGAPESSPSRRVSPGLGDARHLWLRSLCSPHGLGLGGEPSPNTWQGQALGSAGWEVMQAGGPRRARQLLDQPRIWGLKVAVPPIWPSLCPVLT